MATIHAPDSRTFVSVSAGTPLMRACDETSLDIPFVCLVGTCRTCVFRVVKGMDRLSPRTPAEEKLLAGMPHLRLACQVVVQGDVTITRQGLTDNSSISA